MCRMAESSMKNIQPTATNKIIQVEANIRPKDRNKIIEAIVYRTWIARDPPNTTEKGCRAILLDKQIYTCKKIKLFNSLTDYIGCYINSGDSDTIGNPNKDQIVNRKIEIQNLNRVSIELTLWDELAQKFEKDEIDKLERPIIIAISSCRVQRYRNRLQLSSTPASYYYINPKIPQLEQYRAQYRELFNINPPLEIVRQPYEDIEKERMRNRFSLDTLLNQTPKTYEGVRFTCEGSISTINTSRDWYYTACTKCSLKVSNDDGVFQCGVHRALANPSYRYNFKGYLTDGSATTMITFFTPKADIPEKIHSITGKRYIFQFQYNTSSKQVTPDFIFNGLLDQPENPKQIEDKASGSKTAQEEYNTVTIDIPEDQQMALTIQSTPAVTPPPGEISMQPNPTEEQPTEVNLLVVTELAPTPKVYTGMQTRSRTDAMQASTTQFSKTVEQKNIESSEDDVTDQQNYPFNTPVQAEEYFTDATSKSSMANTSKLTTSKRALFQGKTADAKKNKKE
ncbi:nucleic acid-binding, OB-fold protein [Artemisia annua]|uniref:Nucleic acid-binding, OB-fold protein n=1 Tax=Artemisia annua TaxID=35608 RepID=A0A2U1KTJ5_ARTAN|nr:nucleic acid-binding, OB-fold protein [Artemisia annua]